jgi:hypothetical protein
MKRLIFVMTLLLLVLTACGGGGAYERAYVASGDGTNELELSQTEQFRSADDMNVVVKLNSHDSNVEVQAVFYNPDELPVGDPLTVTAGENVSTVVLGLDWETTTLRDENNQPAIWQPGSWSVEIFVDGEKVDTLDFRVGS